MWHVPEKVQRTKADSDMPEAPPSEHMSELAGSAHGGPDEEYMKPAVE